MMRAVVANAALAAALFAPGDVHPHGEDSTVKATMLMRQPLPDYPGKDGVLLSVEFAPGHVDAAHRHPGHAFVYLLEGSVEMQMENGELTTLKPGDIFYENPRDTHLVGRNLSNTGPARLLVFFIAGPGRAAGALASAPLASWGANGSSQTRRK